MESSKQIYDSPRIYTDLRGSKTSYFKILIRKNARESVAKKFAYGTLNSCTNSGLAILNSAFFRMELILSMAARFSA